VGGEHMNPCCCLGYLYYFYSSCCNY